MRLERTRPGPTRPPRSRGPLRPVPAGTLLPLLLAAAVPLLAGCGPSPTDRVILVGTTSTRDAGLLDSLVAAFGASRPAVDAKAVAVGSGEALELGRRGDGDVLLVHAPDGERRFVEAGHGTARIPLMENRFVLVGPPGDPAGVRGAAGLVEAFRRIGERGARFVSRGDDSGTHRRELEIWGAAGVEPSGAWYAETGQGMAETLMVADARGAYTLAVRANVLLLRDRLELTPLAPASGGGPMTANVYSVIPVAGSPHPEARDALVRWLLSESGERVIEGFGRDRFGEPLFRPVDGDSSPEADAPAAPSGGRDGGGP